MIARCFPYDWMRIDEGAHGSDLRKISRLVEEALQRLLQQPGVVVGDHAHSHLGTVREKAGRRASVFGERRGWFLSAGAPVGSWRTRNWCAPEESR